MLKIGAHVQVTHPNHPCYGATGVVEEMTAGLMMVGNIYRIKYDSCTADSEEISESQLSEFFPFISAKHKVFFYSEKYEEARKEDWSKTLRFEENEFEDEPFFYLYVYIDGKWQRFSEETESDNSSIKSNDLIKLGCGENIERRYLSVPLNWREC